MLRKNVFSKYGGGGKCLHSPRPSHPVVAYDYVLDFVRLTQCEILRTGGIPTVKYSYRLVPLLGFVSKRDQITVVKTHTDGERSGEETFGRPPRVYD